MKSRHKILIVEDEPDHMHILANALTTAGYEVAAAYGAEPAFRKAHTQRPDLILTDLAMPQVSGVQSIAALKDDPATRDIPVLAVTAFVWDNLAEAAGEVGCAGFISKPFKREDLLREVAKHLALAEAAARPA